MLLAIWSPYSDQSRLNTCFWQENVPPNQLAKRRTDRWTSYYKFGFLLSSSFPYWHAWECLGSSTSAQSTSLGIPTKLSGSPRANAPEIFICLIQWFSISIAAGIIECRDDKALCFHLCVTVLWAVHDEAVPCFRSFPTPAHHGSQSRGTVVSFILCFWSLAALLKNKNQGTLLAQ